AAVVSSLLMGLSLSGGDSSLLEHWSTRAMALAEKANDPSVRIMSASVLVLHHALRGESEQAEAWLALLQRYSAGGPTALFGQVAARAAAATLAWHQGRLAACADAASEGFALLGQEQVPMWQLALLVFGSHATIERGATAETERFRTKLAELANSSTPLE